MRRRITDTEASMGTGALIIFIAMILLSSIILATMMLIVERLAQNPQQSGYDVLRSTSDKIIVNEMYVLDGFDNYGIIFQLSPGSKSHTADELFWVLQCTDENDVFHSYAGDFASGLQDWGAITFANESVQTGIIARYYDLGTYYSALPDVSLLAPDFIDLPGQINFAVVPGGVAWPGNPYHEQFAATFNGYIDIPADGDYTFSMTSDDGSIMYLDGTQIIDNNRWQAMREEDSAPISLTAGVHSFQIDYFERDGGHGLELRWASAAIPKEIIPAANFFRSIGEGNIATYEPGVIYEINLDQANQAGSSDECGPKHLFEKGLEGNIRFLVGNGGYTHEIFEVHNNQPGTRII